MIKKACTNLDFCVCGYCYKEENMNPTNSTVAWTLTTNIITTCITMTDMDNDMTITLIYLKPGLGLTADWEDGSIMSTNPVSVDVAAHQLVLWLKEYAEFNRFEKCAWKKVLAERIDTCKDALWELGELAVIADVYGIDV